LIFKNVSQKMRFPTDIAIYVSAGSPNHTNDSSS
jgi:hypothetical protein